MKEVIQSADSPGSTGPPVVLPLESQWRTAEAIMCLECGAWKRALGNHLRLTHNLTAAEYRRRWGMRQRQPLTCGEVSDERRRIVTETGGVERIRAFADKMVPIAQAAARGRERRPQELVSVGSLGRQRGQQVRAAAQARIARADEMIAAEGFAGRREWIMARYVAAGWTLTRCDKHLGVGHGTVRAWMRELGIHARPTGPQPRL